MKKHFCILFAGPVGCSKTPVAHYLSIKLNLPIFNNDAIRSEVIEDLGYLNNKEHQKRRDNRLKELLKIGTSFICDASIDREWERYNAYFLKTGYKPVVISFDLSKNLLKKFYIKKGYNQSLKNLNALWNDHIEFLKKYKSVINLNITDKNFNKRLHLSYQKIKRYLATL